jgi:outer membrane protein assembly factor BamB
MVMSILLTPGQTPIAKQVWCAPNQGGGHMNYPPISTTTDDRGSDALVWFVSGGQLTAVDGDTGKLVVTTTGAACDMVPSMSFPIAVKNRIVVATGPTGKRVTGVVCCGLVLEGCTVRFTP